MNLPNSVYTAKFTDKTVLAWTPPANASFKDSKEPSHLQPSNNTTQVYNSATGEQRSPAPFPLPAVSQFVQGSGISLAALGTELLLREKELGNALAPGHPLGTKHAAGTASHGTERWNCANASISYWQAKLLLICRNYPDWNQEA